MLGARHCLVQLSAKVEVGTNARLLLLKNVTRTHSQHFWSGRIALEDPHPHKVLEKMRKKDPWKRDNPYEALHKAKTYQQNKELEESAQIRKQSSESSSTTHETTQSSQSSSSSGDNSKTEKKGWRKLFGW